jgi:hypothetical protein
MNMRQLIFAITLGTAFPVLAHPTGHESRTASDCEHLPGTAAAGERGQCLRCVGRPRPHHYHPDMAPGNRCHADNGQRQ